MVRPRPAQLRTGRPGSRPVHPGLHAHGLSHWNAPWWREGGCFSHCPHDVFLAWFGDVLDILKGHNIGWALWNFRGNFGILDSNRSDVAYEDWRGHQLDRSLLELLQKY